MKIIKKMFIWIDLLLYIIFSYVYSSDGLKVQLATESSTLHKVYTDYGYYYSCYYFKPISPFLCKIGLVGMLVTGILFLIIGTYKTYKKIENIEEIKLNYVTSAIIIIFIVALYTLLLHLIRGCIYVNFCMQVGECPLG